MTGPSAAPVTEAGTGMVPVPHLPALARPTTPWPGRRTRGCRGRTGVAPARAPASAGDIFEGGLGRGEARPAASVKSLPPLCPTRGELEPVDVEQVPASPGEHQVPIVHTGRTADSKRFGPANLPVEYLVTGQASTAHGPPFGSGEVAPGGVGRSGATSPWLTQVSGGDSAQTPPPSMHREPSRRTRPRLPR